MFWLSYESTSILSDIFCQKSVISSYPIKKPMKQEKVLIAGIWQ